MDGRQSPRLTISCSILRTFTRFAVTSFPPTETAMPHMFPLAFLSQPTDGQQLGCALQAADQVKMSLDEGNELTLSQVLAKASRNALLPKSIDEVGEARGGAHYARVLRKWRRPSLRTDRPER